MPGGRPTRALTLTHKYAHCLTHTHTCALHALVQSTHSLYSQVSAHACMHCTLTYTCTLTYSHSHAHTLAYHAQAHSHMHSAHSHIRHSRYTYIHTHMHTHAYSHTHSHNSHSPIHIPIIHMHTRILTLRHAARFNIHAFHTLIKLHSHSHTLSRAHATCPCSPGPLGGVGAPRLVLLGTTRPESTKPPPEGPLSRWALQMAIHWPH